MTHQALLAHIGNHYDFARANQVVAVVQSKPFIRAWMAVDFSQAIAKALGAKEIDFAVPYQQGKEYLKYNAKNQQVEKSESRFASKADLKVTTDQGLYWFEFHALHQNSLKEKKDRDKLYQDVERVKALQTELSKENVILLIGIWGSFTSKDMEHFKAIDNSTYFTYVLDSGLSGSTQVARLCQMHKEGEERFLLASF